MAASSDEIDLRNPPFPLTSVDRELLSMRDRDFHRITWEDLGRLISNNNLEQLKRSPSDLRRYLQWSHDTKLKYGSITDFVVRIRLKWTPQHEVTSDQPLGPASFSHRSAVPFEDHHDFTILKNDWPYGFEKGITHILAWSRTPIAVDDVQGDVTIESRRLIEQFVHNTFVRQLAKDEKISEQAAAERVLWFKNWVSLQSVRGVDHVHILVKDVSARLSEQWTERV